MEFTVNFGAKGCGLLYTLEWTGFNSIIFFVNKTRKHC